MICPRLSHSLPGGSSRTAGILALLLFTLFASAAAAQTRTLADLVVEGNTTVDAQLIRNVSGFRTGGEVSRESIQQAIHQIYGLNLFSDVQILGEEHGEGVRIVIRVTELPRLDKAVFKGNKELKEKAFGLTFRRGQPVGPNVLREAERKIRAAYQEKGFFLVDIESTLEPTGVTGEVSAVFEIRENKPVGVEAVVFEGTQQMDAGELRGKVKNKRRGFLKSIFGGGKFNREKHDEDKAAIINHYKKNGFLDAVIVSDTIILNERKTDVTLKYTINEGPRYYFGASEFTGQTLLSEEQLRRGLKYNPGDVFNQERYERSVGELYTMYQEEGYLYARVIDETRTTDSTVNITYEISEGVPAHVHRINIEGNTKTKDKVIRRELAIYPGQVFRRSSLMRSLQNVMRLNYFANVVPDYTVLPDGRVDLSIAVEEKPTGQIQVGGGYSGQDKFVGTVSLGIPNLFGNGQEANFSVDYGSRRQSYSLSFTEPWFRDTPTSVGIDLFDLERSWDEPLVSGVDDYTENRTGFGLRLGRRLTWPDDYFRVFWRYRFERVEFRDFSASYLSTNASNNFSLEKVKWPQTTSSTSFTVSRDTRDLPEFATRGTRSGYEIEFAGGALGGDWSFTRHSLSHARYHRLWKGLTLAPVFRLGVLEGSADIGAIPHSERFYAGGTRSDGMIRGYDDGAIVARINDSTVTGFMPGLVSGDIISDAVIGDGAGRYRPFAPVRGRTLGIMNAEMRFPIASQQIYGLMFFDAGNVWLDPSQIRLSNLLTSYGFGFRLAVPGMGTLGFDFGFPNQGVEKGKIKPHFQFGSSF